MRSNNRYIFSACFGSLRCTEHFPTAAALVGESVHHESATLRRQDYRPFNSLVNQDACDINPSEFFKRQDLSRARCLTTSVPSGDGDSTMLTGQETSELARPINLMNAVNKALTKAMEDNQRTLIFGEDVAFGGVFRCTAGLRERFGAERVFNTPLSEQGIAGFAVGAAAKGMRAVAEIQFADYVYPAMDQVINEMSKFRYRSGGVFDCGGVTMRMPYGAVGHGGHYHSQSPEAIFTHIPGIKVVMPSTPSDAYSLLLASINDPDPVVFFEPKMLYRSAVEAVDLEDPATDLLGKARIFREGQDITIVSWGQQVVIAMQAAEELEQMHGISCEVIDLRTLIPWDVDTVEASVNKTGRLLVTHEAPVTSGFGAEVIANITKRCFVHLESPPVRVCGYDTPFPCVLEPVYMPSSARLVEAVHSSVKF